MISGPLSPLFFWCFVPFALDEFTNMVRELVHEMGLELILVELKGSNTKLLKILVDLPDNDAFSGKSVSIDACATLSRQLGDYLEQEPELENFTLEVGSPGLDRVLKSCDDFSRHQNAIVAIKLKEPSSKYFKGLLQTVVPEQKQILLLVDGNEIKILLEEIREARVDYFASQEWKKAQLAAQLRKHKKQKR